MTKPHIPIDRTMILLSFAFAAAWTVTSAMAAHLPRIVEAFGATPAQAVFAGMMIGPAQVGARVFQASVLSRFHPVVATRLACITHPIGACAIGIFGGGAAAAFALLHGAGNGILTIARGTLPLAIFGPENYAYRLGVIGAPSRICQAVAPRRVRTVDRADGSRHRRGVGVHEPCRAGRAHDAAARQAGDSARGGGVSDLAMASGFTHRLSGAMR